MLFKAQAHKKQMHQDLMKGFCIDKMTAVLSLFKSRERMWIGHWFAERKVE